MLPVIYSMSVSLDRFIAGPDSDIGWTAMPRPGRFETATLSRRSTCRDHLDISNTLN